jgi:hypothetical protein
VSKAPQQPAAAAAGGSISDDLTDLHAAAVAVQDALGLLVDRLEVVLPPPPSVALVATAFRVEAARRG